MLLAHITIRHLAGAGTGTDAVQLLAQDRLGACPGTFRERFGFLDERIVAPQVVEVGRPEALHSEAGFEAKSSEPCVSFASRLCVWETGKRGSLLCSPLVTNLGPRLCLDRFLLTEPNRECKPILIRIRGMLGISKVEHCWTFRLHPRTHGQACFPGRQPRILEPFLDRCRRFAGFAPTVLRLHQEVGIVAIGPVRFRVGGLEFGVQMSERGQVDPPAFASVRVGLPRNAKGQVMRFQDPFSNRANTLEVSRGREAVLAQGPRLSKSRHLMTMNE